ncbi:MAG: type II toxin-antitoxin system VapC family toxin [Blastocatellales bacterium]
MDTDLVVDTSTIIAVIANEPEKPLLIAKTQGYELVAPRSLYWEIGNAFSAMIKRGRITLEQATLAVEIYEQIQINLIDVDLKQALEIVDQRKVYAYDAYMIACALNRGCPLLTLNRTRKDWHSPFSPAQRFIAGKRANNFFQPDSSGFAAASAKAVCKPDESGWSIICDPFPSRERLGYGKASQCFLF